MAADPVEKLRDEIKNLSRITRLSNKARKKLIDTQKDATKALGQMGKGLAGGIVSKLVDILFSFPPQLKKMETFGAKFSKSFEQSFQESKKLSDSIQGGVGVYDSFVFGLATSRRGLDANNAALQDLAALTHATGESVGELLIGMTQVSLGLGDNQSNILSLNKTMEKTSRAFNRSREELVKAMSKLTQSTLNLLAMGGATGTQFQEGLMLLKSFVPDEQLFSQVTGSIQQLLAPAGLTRSLMLGLDTSKYLKGIGNVEDLLIDTLELGKKGQRISQIAQRASGPGLQASIGQLQSVFGDMGDFMRGAEAVRQMAHSLEIETQGKTSKQLVQAIMREGKKRADENTKFHQTIKVIQDSILRPLKDGMADVGLKLKEVLKGSAGGLRTLVKTITRVMMTLVGGLLELIAKFVGWTTDLDDTLRKESAAIFKMRDSFEEESDTAKGQRAKLIANSDPKKQKDLTNAFKMGNMLAVRQTDALLGDVVRLLTKDNRLLQGIQRGVNNPTLLGGGGGGPSIRQGVMPGGGG